MRAARPYNDRKFQIGRDIGNIFRRLGDCHQFDPCHAMGCGNLNPVDAAQQTMQLVAIEVADRTGPVEQRPRPARRHRIDLAQRLKAFFRIRGNHDRHVMFGKRHRQIDARDDIKRLQFDAGIFQEKLDRGVAAHVDRGRQRQHPQFRLFRRTGRTIQLMKGEHFGLDRHAGLLVAQKLRDQRQIEALACLRGAVGKLANQLVAQGAQVGPFERHRRQPGKADSIRARIARKAGRDILTIHEMHPSV